MRCLGRLLPVALCVAVFASSAAAQESKWPKKRPFDNFQPVIPAGADGFLLRGSGWDGPGLGSADLTYFFDGENTSPAFPGDLEQDIIEQALDLWASVAQIDFTEVAAPGLSRSLDITWAPVDGSGEVLAFAFLPAPLNPEPIAGDVVFDVDENWITGFTPGAGIALLPVAIHELGHTIGLGHTQVENAIMFAFYGGGSVEALSFDDVAGVRALYAPRFPAFAARVRGSHTGIGDLIIRVGVREPGRGRVLWQRPVHLRAGANHDDFDYVEIDLAGGRAFLNGNNDWFVSVDDVAQRDEGTLELFEIRINRCVKTALSLPQPIRNFSTTDAEIVALEDAAGCAPRNDDCGSATTIMSLPFSEVLVDTSSATTEPADPTVSCGDAGTPQQSNSVWYAFTPSDDGLISIDTSGTTDYEAVLSVYTGRCGSLTEVGCAVSVPSLGIPARLSALPVTEDEPVLIEVTQLGEPGGGVMQISVQPSVCDHVIEISGYSFVDTVDTTTATTGPPAPDVCAPTDHTVWYTFAAPTAGVMDIDTAGTDYDSVLTVLSGPCDNLSAVACNDDTATLQAALLGVPVDAGQTILIGASAFLGDPGGTLQFSFRFQPSCFEPPTVPTAPMPADGALDLEIDTDLAWVPGHCGELANALPNGGFEAGSFQDWTTTTGDGVEFQPWTVTTGGTGWFANGLPFDCEHFAQNGFEGQAGLHYEISRTVEIPAGTTSAILAWAERIQWDMRQFEGTQPREYAARIRVAGASSYTTLYAVSLEPETQGDTGYVVHIVDLLSLDPTLAGQPVEISFRQDIPETFTGPAQFDLDAVRLTFDTPRPSRTASASGVAQAQPAKAERRFAGAAALPGARIAAATALPVEATTFDVYFGTDPNDLPLLGSTPATQWVLPRLDGVTTYYWRADARNRCGTTAGPVWSFTTRAAHPPALAASDPPDGHIDPRTEIGGIDRITLTFERPVTNADGTPLDATAFSVLSTDNPTLPGAPDVPAVARVDVTADPRVVVVTLEHPIPVGEWTKLSAEVATEDGTTGTVAVRLGHLPCDMDQNGKVTISDVTVYSLIWRRIGGDLTPLDTDRSGVVTAGDPSEFGLLWRGAGGRTDWAGRKLPPIP